ncbi:hypothetical protein [Acinetobacter sp. ANC 4648]|uniref:hypothetical protein n=1 Tax=Acinetobacter sp. ANC 4648 TaxID=1977875 RepID=UPI000A34D1B9|nr:hypothetical protein [Acinetobacter sp. ANC 4648]OTG79412.1 hypothetical protein B9T27_14540 [Acinetobacter sp. ANC 4648]
MKSIILGLALIFSCVTAFAATEARSMRSPSGVIVGLGDSHQTVTRAFEGDRPISVNRYFLDEGRTYGSAVDYVYQVNNSIYTITVLRNNVYRIVWERR